VRELEPGDHGREPVQTRFGWHVLKLEDTRELEAPGFDEVKQGVVASLQRQRMESYVEDLRAKADIKVTKEFAGSPAPDPTAAPAARPKSGAEPPEEEDSSGN
jgi:peptidyl-prolyl cis-trans isomerase C